MKTTYITRPLTLCVFCAFSWLILPVTILADLFGTGPNQFEIDFVTISHAGNIADSTGHGAVGYEYRIGRTEVSIDQFFKARALDVRIGSGNEDYWNDGTRTVGTGAAASEVSWFEAAMFCNWLTTGDAHQGVYQFDGGGTLTSIDRSYRNINDLAYVLPTEDEWYKAGYFKPDASGYSLYADGGNSQPLQGVGGWNYYDGTPALADPNYTWDVTSGGSEQNTTLNMMGNLQEWCESAEDGLLDDLNERRVTRGGGYATSELQLRSSGRSQDIPSDYTSGLGFRVASIPEPSSALLLMVGAGGMLFIRRGQRMKWRR